MLISMLESAYLCNAKRKSGVSLQNQSLPLKNSMCTRAQSLSRVRLFAILWTVACQAPLSMGFSRQEYWSGLPFHLSGDFSPPRD